MTSQELREKFLEFFKREGHAVVPSSSLLPDDPSVLFTTAGVQQFKPYYTGDTDPMKDFGSKNTASVQKSMRTTDIDEVGDESHLTFFEMLGNFSFGGYFKEEAIKWGYEFITKELGLEIDYVTVFAGEDNIPSDDESEKIWKEINPKIEVRKEGREDNFWGPTGEEGPCGPTTEIYVRGTEIWNIVFNEFYCHKGGEMENLKTSGIDTGMGLERLAMVVQNVPTVFETDLFKALFEEIPDELSVREKRIIADHIRASVFLLSEGVRPSNKEQGYVLRRLIRRAHAITVKIKENDILLSTAENVIKNYGIFYKEISENKDKIINALTEEQKKFSETLSRGLRELKKLEKIDAKLAFDLYQSYGLPFETIKDSGKEKTENLKLDDFDKEFARHQEISKSGVEKKFGGHGLLLDTGELKAGSEEELQTVLRLHTATHLVQAALRKILGTEIKQMGSDITSKRARFDFSFNRKITDNELAQIENMVNEVAAKGLDVSSEEMRYEDAVKAGALAFFKGKYPETVKVYTIQDTETDEVFSKEICGGPHVKNTSEVGNFKIIKQESVGSGVRRIRFRVQ